jgi:AcrR family transcriptional regulator
MRAKVPAVGEQATPDAIPQLVRPSREVAIEVAEAFFKRGLRVDMQTVADRLGIGRTTLYRWVGDREQLIGEVLARLTDVTWQLVEGTVTGQGAERAVRSIEAFMTLTSTWPPLRGFAQREPQLALRILLLSEAPVSAHIRGGIEAALARHVPNFDIDANQDLLDTIVQIGTALEWAPIAIGEEPAIKRAVRLIRGLLEPFGHPPSPEAEG